MSYGGGGKSRITVPSGGGGLSQGDDQVLNQSRQMSRAFLVTEHKVVEFLALFYPLQPVFNYGDPTSLQDCSHPFLFHAHSRFAGEQLVANVLRKFTGFEWLHNDFVRFQ